MLTVSHTWSLRPLLRLLSSYPIFTSDHRNSFEERMLPLSKWVCASWIYTKNGKLYISIEITSIVNSNPDKMSVSRDFPRLWTRRCCPWVNVTCAYVSHMDVMLSALLALWEVGHLSVDSPHSPPVIWSFDVFSAISLNKLLKTHWWSSLRFETPWCSYNVTVMAMW